MRKQWIIGPMEADDYMKGYLPDFDTAARRAELELLSKEDLIDKLLRRHKDALIMAMTADLLGHRLARIAELATASTLLPNVDRPPENFPKE